MDSGAPPAASETLVGETTDGSVPEARDPLVMAQWVRRGGAAVVHALVFALFLLGLRIAKLLMYEGATPTAIQWLQVISAELSLVLLIEAVFLLTIRIAPSWTRAWAAASMLVHVPIYILVIVVHRFYYETRIILKVEEFRYALREMSMLSELISTGVDTVFLVLLLIAVVCVAAGPLTLYRWRGRAWTASILVPGLMTLAGAALMLVPPPNHVRLVAFAGNWLTDLLPERAVQEYLNRPVQIREVYSAPVLAPAAQDPLLSSQRPNFLLVVLESTGTDVFSAYTKRKSLTPFFDELAAESLVVDNAYTTVSHTTKALVGILCGMKPVPTMDTIETKPLHLPLKCLPHLLHEAGYSSGYFQSAGNFEHRVDLVKNMGFATAFIPVQGPASARTGYLGWDERVLIRPMVQWLSQAKRPFFATLLTLSTHHPYDAKGSGAAPTRALRREYYDKAVGHVDGILRQLFAQLEQQGVLKNTVVIVVGDHGEAFGQRSGFFQHDRVPYEEVTRTPLMLYSPERFSPGRIAGLRQQTDILPTVLELAQVPWTGLLPGMSLLSSAGHPQIVTSCWYPAACLSLRRGPLSFVFHFGRVPLEVFDVESDPLQLNDISNRIDVAVKEQAIDSMLGEMASVHTYYTNAFQAIPEALQQ